MRRQNVVILALLALCLLVVPAGAWQEDFQSGTAYGWTVEPWKPASPIGCVSVVQSPYSDTYALESRALASYGGVGWYVYPNPKQVFEYAAFTIVASSASSSGGRPEYISILSEDGATLCTFSLPLKNPSPPNPRRVEIIRDGFTAYLYVNGTQQGSGLACNGQPYNLEFLTISDYSGPAVLVIDDVVIGTGEPGILGIIPEGWYVLEHPTIPVNSGLYDDGGTLIYPDRMHATYGLVNPADNNTKIVLQAMGAGSPINTTHLPVGTRHGIITYNITELLINNPDAKPGYYFLKLMQDDAVYDSGLFPFTNGGGTISFDADSYVTSETAIVSHEIESLFFSQEYTYRGQIVDIYGTEKTSWPINSQTGTHPVDLTGYSTGEYFLLLKATDRDTGEEYVFDVDTAEVDEEIWVNGTAYDAETGLPLANVTVEIGQSGTITSNVTVEDGSYAPVTGLRADTPITVNASCANYTHTNFSFTSLGNGLKTVNLYLVPSPPNFTGAAIGGLVYHIPYRQAVGGATVTIANDTWNDTTIANSTTGYYIFNDLAVNESYTVRSTLTGYQPSGVYTAVAQNETFVRQDIEIRGLYTLTIEIRDAADHALITSSMTVEADGATNVTTNGQTQFHNLEYGIVTVAVAGNDDYYGASENILVEKDTRKTIYLARKTESTPFAYPPHNVRFVVRSAFGAPIEGVTVEATGYETTMGSWSWLLDLLGIDYGKTQVHNQTMTGTTGSDGGIDFMMFEAIKYRVTFYKDGVINTTWEGFPKDEYYTIWAPRFGTSEWFEHGVNPLEAVNFTVTGTTATEDEATITVYYNDTLKNTTGAAVYLNQTFTNGTEILVQQYLGGTAATWNHTFNLPGDHRGESYIVRLRAQHETLGNITRDYGVYYKPAPISFGLPEDLLLYGAMLVMIFTALFFGQSSVGAGCIVFAFEGWLFYWIGWLQDLGSEYVVGTALIIISLVAVLVNVMQRSKRERYA